jgi:hypothetical protein
VSDHKCRWVSQRGPHHRYMCERHGCLGERRRRVIVVNGHQQLGPIEVLKCAGCLVRNAVSRGPRLLCAECGGRA